MTASVPAVLAKLATNGVSVQWRDGKAVFKAAAAPPADIVALIDARKVEVSAFLHPDAVRRRLEAEAEAEVLRAPCPSDITPDRWTTALAGLRAFIAAGYSAEAERLGWPRDELYRVPPLWSRVDLTGVALLVGDDEVIAVTPGEIRVKTPAGSTHTFYRAPEPDLALIYRNRLQRTRCDSAAGDEEAKLRAIEHTAGVYRAHRAHRGHACTLEQAAAAVWVAIAAKGIQP